MKPADAGSVDEPHVLHGQPCGFGVHHHAALTGRNDCPEISMANLTSDEDARSMPLHYLLQIPHRRLPADQLPILRLAQSIHMLR